jgi:hypothetical protein
MVKSVEHSLKFYCEFLRQYPMSVVYTKKFYIVNIRAAIVLASPPITWCKSVLENVQNLILDRNGQGHEIEWMISVLPQNHFSSDSFR